MGIGNKPPFGLRLPDELKQWVKDSANSNHRSMNSEVIARLEQCRRQEEAKRAEAAK